MAIYVLSVLVLGLMCGSELNVGALAHRALNAQPLETHILMRASLARLFGRLMPFWMAGSAVLNILLLLPFSHLAPASLAACVARRRAPGARDYLFTRRAGAHQQPHHEVDAANSA